MTPRPFLSSVAIAAALSLPALAQITQSDPATSVATAFFQGQSVADCIGVLRASHGLNIVLKGRLGDEPVHASFRNVSSAHAAAAILDASGYDYSWGSGNILIVEGLPAAPAAEPVADEQSVKPGINESFLNPNLNVGSFVDRFSGESREVFVQRTRIAKALGLEAGMEVADIGAGTGIYLDLFARGVGDTGTVFAVDLAEQFVERLGELAKQRGYTQVQPIQCTERSAELPPNAIDRAFICDTYHHFEYPSSTMASILAALRPGGELLIVDFERIPGISREWLLGHVRAGRDAVCAEIASFGFEFVEFVPIEGLRETYVVRFRKPQR